MIIAHLMRLSRDFQRSAKIDANPADHPSSKPSPHDAELELRVYDLRRESVMREARDAITNQFWPQSYEDVAAPTQQDLLSNANWRRTSV